MAQQATLATGWDVVTPDDCLLTNYTWALMAGANGMGAQSKQLGSRFSLQRGQLLQAKDATCRQFYLLLEVGPLLAAGCPVIGPDLQHLGGIHTCNSLKGMCIVVCTIIHHCA